MKKILRGLSAVAMCSVLVSGCGSLEPGTPVSAESSSTQASPAELQQEYKDILKGTLDASGSELTSFKFPSGMQLTEAYFSQSDEPEVCGKAADGTGKYYFRGTLNSSTELSAEEYQKRVEQVWDYWESLGMKPKNISPAETGRSIAATTPLGGEVSFMSSLYGEMITIRSVCTVDLRPAGSP